MADVAQMVRAPVCGTGGRGFDPHHSPQIQQPDAAESAVDLEPQ